MLIDLFLDLIFLDCSEITKNLLVNIMKVNECYIRSVPLRKEFNVEGVLVTFYEANHCPGAVIILFKMPDGKYHLHTGDLRFNLDVQDHKNLMKFPITNCYLDTTYCDPKYIFPKQEKIINTVMEYISCHKKHRTLFVFGSYTIGKEKLFLEASDRFKWKIYVNSRKEKVINCLNLTPTQSSMFTRNKEEAQIHVVMMNHLTYQSMSKYIY